jgi:hypothetical protein
VRRLVPSSSPIPIRSIGINNGSGRQANHLTQTNRRPYANSVKSTECRCLLLERRSMKIPAGRAGYRRCGYGRPS